MLEDCVVKILILPKLIYRFSATPNQISANRDPSGKQQVDSKIHKSQVITTWKKKNEVGDLTLLDIPLIYLSYSLQ